jgi:hypothetical protein
MHAARLAQHSGFHIVARVHVDPAHELDELAGFGGVVAAVFVSCFAYKAKRHNPTFPYPIYGKAANIYRAS